LVISFLLGEKLRQSSPTLWLAKLIESRLPTNFFRLMFQFLVSFFYVNIVFV
jgi:hypothetical protein